MSSLALRLTSRVLPRAFNASLKSKNIWSKVVPSACLNAFPPSSVDNTLRFFSDSHDDFATKRKPVDSEDEAMNMIKEHVEGNRVMLYMKGKPAQPMCGFSAKVVGALKKEGIDFSSVNVLDYPQIREGVKKYSDWPTVPQLYVNGEFIGGCDIVMDLHEQGELAEILKDKEN